MADLDVYKKQKFGQKIGFGKRPVLLIIDFQVGFSDADVLGGFNMLSAIDQTAKLLKTARSLKIPVAHVRFATEMQGDDIGTFAIKVPTLRKLSPDSKDAQFVESLTPLGPIHYFLQGVRPAVACAPVRSTLQRMACALWLFQIASVIALRDPIAPTYLIWNRNMRIW